MQMEDRLTFLARWFFYNDPNLEVEALAYDWSIWFRGVSFKKNSAATMIEIA